MKYLFAFVCFALPVFGQDTTLMEEYYPSRTKTVVEQALEHNCRQYLCGRIKIKEGALNEVRQWFQTLQNRKNELLEAFALEGVWLESVFLEHTNQGDFLVYYMRQDDIEKVYENLAKFQLPVRLFHIDCCQKYCNECIVLEPLFDLTR